MIRSEKTAQEIKTDSCRCGVVMEPTDDSLTPDIRLHRNAEGQRFGLRGCQLPVERQNGKRGVIELRVELASGRLEVGFGVAGQALEQFGDAR